MPSTFVKDILKPNRKYHVSTRGGGRRDENFSMSRLQGWVDKFYQMKSAGYSVPAPWKHDGSTPIKVTEGSGPEAYDSRLGAGRWEDIWVDAGKGLLMGRLCSDSPDVKKIGTDVREVSPHIAYGWKDGDGNAWDDFIAHIALVQHPVVMGQQNFQPIQSEGKLIPDEFAVSLSADSGALDASLAGYESGSQPATGATVTEAIRCLAEVGVTLPNDTSPENLIERIVVACGALAAAQEDDSVDEEETELKPTPIAMSTTTPADKKQVPPAKPEDKTLSAEDIQLALGDPTQNRYIALASDGAKSKYQSRIDELISSGRITKDYAEKRLAPKLAGFSLSLGTDGKPVPTELDRLLDDLEALPKRSDAFLGPNDEETEEGEYEPERGEDGRFRQSVARDGKSLDDSVKEQMRLAGRA